MSIQKQIVDVLRKDGSKVYFPEQHEGECLNNYLVVKSEGAIPLLGTSSERPIYTIMCYVPKNRYSDLESLVFKTKQKMKELYPMLMYAGNESPSIYDEDLKAHMVSFQYQGCRRIKYSNNVI